MEKDAYRQNYEFDKVHFWFLARRAILLGLMGQWLSGRHAPKILDVGCGTGANLELLRSLGPVTGVDSSEDALNFCRKRGLRPVVKGAAEKLPFKKESFDVVVALDLLEHLPAEDKGLREFHRVLKKDGLLFLTVPAFPSLWSDFDELGRHYRRYTKKDLLSKLLKNGFVIKKLSFYNFFLFFPIVAVRLKDNYLNFGKPPVSDILKPIPPILNRLFYKVMLWELPFLKRFDLPFGISLIGVAVKK